MNVDLHIHSKYSDGENTISEILELLINNNINTFSITDHDDIKSCKEIKGILLPNNMKYIRGVEFSSTLKEYNCHILGYGFDDSNNIIDNECKKIKDRRHQKIDYIINELINKFNIEITTEERKKILTKNGTIGRYDLCELLLTKTLGTRKEIYDKYLRYPKELNHRSNAADIISTIHKANGVAILAHPKEIEYDYQIEFEDIIKYFLEIGIDGIEVYNSIHELKDVKKYLLLATKYNLLTTGGSDFHGANVKPDIQIGRTTTKKIKIHPSNINFKWN